MKIFLLMSQDKNSPELGSYSGMVEGVFFSHTKAKINKVNCIKIDGDTHSFHIEERETDDEPALKDKED